MGRVIVIVARLSKLRVKIGGDDDGSVTACVSWGADENDVAPLKLTCSPYSVFRHVFIQIQLYCGSQLPNNCPRGKQWR